MICGSVGMDLLRPTACHCRRVIRQSGTGTIGRRSTDSRRTSHVDHQETAGSVAAIESTDAAIEAAIVPTNSAALIEDHSGHEEEIRPLAYRKWQEAGCPVGDGIEFWLAAETEILRRKPR